MVERAPIRKPDVPSLDDRGRLPSAAVDQPGMPAKERSLFDMADDLKSQLREDRLHRAERKRLSS